MTISLRILCAGDKRITVEIPSITNPEEAVQKLGSTAKLQFIDADGNVVIEGKDVEKSEALNGAVDQTGILQNYVKLTLNSEATSVVSHVKERV